MNIAADVTNVYWPDSASSNVMKCAVTEFAAATPTFVSGQSSPYGIAADGTNVYWTNQGTSANDGSVMRCAAGTCANLTVLASGQSAPQGIAVDATSVYWTNYGDGTVMKVAK